MWPVYFLTLLATSRIQTFQEPVLAQLPNGGFQFRLADAPGTWSVGFHYSINSPVRGTAGGRYNRNVFTKTGDSWVLNVTDIVLHPHDTVYYWVHRTVNGATFTITDKSWKPEIPLKLVFDDHFDTLNMTSWEHEVTASGGGNWEFQIYSQDPNNSYVRDNTLFIKPTLTSDRFGVDFVENGKLNMTELFGKCTQSEFYGCYREAGASVLNPIMSARLITKVSFKYGRVEIIAKMPRGDWLWPAMWFLPKDWAYGGWPASGEIDLVEVRGNRNYGEIGIQTMGSTLHWGPRYDQNGYLLTTHERHAKPKWTWADGFHKYVLDWDSTHIRTYVDDQLVLDRPTPTQGYWKFGNFSGDDVWVNGGPDAPFDQRFYLILNVAVGGTIGYFPDTVENKPTTKPWQNDASDAPKTFWEAKDDWYPTWHGEDAALQVKSVKIWEKIPPKTA